MKKIILPLLVVMLALAGCRTASDESTSYADAGNECIGENCAVIKYDTPNGNDLVLETDHHVIQIAAQPETKYSYYVWTGGKTTADDPDMIVEDGNTMILVEE